MQRAGLLLWGLWLLTHYVTFSFADGTFHPYYTTMLAPAIAALTGAGVVALLRAFRTRSAVWAWVLPLAIAVTAVWAIVLLRRDSGFAGWLWPVIAVLAVAAVAVLLVARAGTLLGGGSGSRGGGSGGPARLRLRLMAAGAVAALVALLAGPAAYAADTVTAGAIQGVNPTGGPTTAGGMGGMGFPGGASRDGGTGGFPGGSRGEMSAGGPGGGSGASGQRPGGTTAGTPPTGAEASGAGTTGRKAPGGEGSGDRSFGDRSLGDRSGGSGTPGGGVGGGGMGGGVSTAMLSYLEAHQGTATWLVATSDAQSAAEIILQSGGRAAIGMGGFTGDDPAMTLSKLKGYIASGKLHYVLVDGTGSAGGPGGGQANAAATAYVTSNCTVVKASEYGGSTTTAAGTTASESLYYCG